MLCFANAFEVRVVTDIGVKNFLWGGLVSVRFDLAIINCSLAAALRAAAALVYDMLPRPSLCMILCDYVSRWNLFRVLVVVLYR